MLPTSISNLSNIQRGNHKLLCYFCFLFFFFFTRLSLPATHNPAPAIYLCQLALMPARHQVPLLVSRRQPVCTKWCHPRIHLLSWFQSLQLTTGRQWSERLQPRGFPSKFFLFPSTKGSWHWFPWEGISREEPVYVHLWHRIFWLCCPRYSSGYSEICVMK